MSSDAVVLEPKRPHYARTFTPAVVAGDCATACIVATTAAIPVSIIDYSIMARVAGVTDSSMKELVRGFKTLLFRPHKFFFRCAENKCSLVFRVCFVVYGLTYVASNTTKTYCESSNFSAGSTGFTVGIASGVVNTIASAWKDGVILQALPPVNTGGGLKSSKYVPWVTRALFCTRDTLTCVAAFTLAPILANWLSNYYYRPISIASYEGKEHHEYYAKKIAAAKALDQSAAERGLVALPISTADVSQLVTPAVLQLVTTAIHIAAIRYKQTYPKFDMNDFGRSLHETYLTTTALRICRIVPAFGFGGILNREMRWNMLDRSEGPTFD